MPTTHDVMRQAWAGGTAARPLADKLGELASGRDFGAQGDGAADDRGALAAGLAAVAVLHLTPGTYRVASALTVPAGRMLVLWPGAVLAPAAGATVTVDGTLVKWGPGATGGAGTVAAGAGSILDWSAVPAHGHAIAEVSGLQGALDGKQAADPTLTALAAVTTAADRLIYATGPDAFTTHTLTAFARGLLDDGNAGSARTTLGLGTMAVLDSGLLLPAITYLTTPGSHAVTVPTGRTAAHVIAVGGGGAGAGARSSGQANGGAGGGAGGFAEALVTGLTPGATIGCQVGIGGASVLAEHGGDGGSTIFDTTANKVVAGGGKGGLTQAGGGNSAGGAGGAASASGAGVVAILARDGYPGSPSAPAYGSIGGDMNGLFNPAGAAGVPQFDQGDGSSAWGYGWGGGGAHTGGDTQYRGGNGAPGLLIVHWH